MCAKLSRALFFLRAAKHNLTLVALKSLYYSLFHSHIVYGIHVWSCCTPSTYDVIFKKQKLAVRAIHNSVYNAHTEPLFKSANILPLPFLIDFFALQFIQQFIQGFLPTSFNDTWLTNAHRRENEFQIVLRNDADLYVPFAITLLIERQPLVRFPKT